MSDSGQGSSGPFGGFGRGFGGGGGPGGRGKFFDDLAGVAGGAFSVLAGARAEIEAMVQAQTEALTARLNLVKREELDATLEVARRAREENEALSTRLTALEARLDAMAAAPTPTPSSASPASPAFASTPAGPAATAYEAGSNLGDTKGATEGL